MLQGSRLTDPLVEGARRYISPSLRALTNIYHARDFA